MPPHDGADEQVDWDAIRRAWGVGFPSDYIAFMSTYGAGGIDDALSVVTPEASTQPADSPDLGGMAAETANMRHMWESDGGPNEVDAGPDSVVAWGVSCGADILGWLTLDHDPNKWPVVVWERHGWPHWKSTTAEWRSSFGACSPRTSTSAHSATPPSGESPLRTSSTGARNDDGGSPASTPTQANPPHTSA